MAGRVKDVVVVVVDVGPHMLAHLPHLRKSLFLFAESKLLHSPAHEVAVVLYGTTETSNDPNREMAAEGQADQYQHINTMQPIVCTSLATLQLMNTLSCGQGLSDHVNALVVGMDLIKKAIKARPLLAGARARRRIMLMGSFDTEVDPLDAEFRGGLERELAATDTALEVYCIGGGAPAPTPEAEEHRAANLSGLHDLLAQVPGSYRDVPGPTDMSALFTLGGVASTGFLFPLRLGPECTIEVQVFKKTDRKKLPSLKAHNPGAGLGMSGLVKSEVEYRDPANPDEPLPSEQMVRAFRYGQQLVPIPDAATADMMTYAPGKCLDLIGFTDLDNIPRWQFASECWVALACQRDKPTEHAVALSALVQALQLQGKAAVIRYCRTDRADVALMAGLPLLAPSTSMTQLDGLLLVKLPFKDDMRQLAFRSFNDASKPHLYPTVQQANLMQRLVANMQIGPSAGATAGSQAERLVPDDTLNPMIQRFYYFMGQRAMDPDFEVPSPHEDLLAAAVLDQPPLQELPEMAREALRALPEVFPITAPAAPSATQAGGGSSGAGGAQAGAAAGSAGGSAGVAIATPGEAL